MAVLGSNSKNGGNVENNRMQMEPSRLPSPRQHRDVKLQRFEFEIDYFASKVLAKAIKADVRNPGRSGVLLSNWLTSFSVLTPQQKWLRPISRRRAAGVLSVDSLYYPMEG